MPSKLKAAPKKSKTPPVPVPTPLRFDLPVRSVGKFILASLLEQRTTLQLKEDLRSRGVAIPKNKEDMADRLALHLAASAAVLTASLI